MHLVCYDYESMSITCDDSSMTELMSESAIDEREEPAEFLSNFRKGF